MYDWWFVVWVCSVVFCGFAFGADHSVFLSFSCGVYYLFLLMLSYLGAEVWGSFDGLFPY